MITRSPGTSVTVAGIPYLVGGGYEGKTKELDDLVQRAAEMLQKAFKRPVEIRFNSHRESGKAFVNEADNPLQTCFGLGGSIRHVKPEGMTHEEFILSPFEFYRAQPQALYISTYIEAQWLQDPSQANAKDYDSREHASLAEGLDYLQSHLKKEG